MKQLKLTGMIYHDDENGRSGKCRMTQDIYARYTADAREKTLSLSFAPENGKGFQITVPAEPLIALLKKARA